MEGAGQGYAPPTVRDYGDFVAVTEANATMLHVGVGGVGVNSFSAPATPSGGTAGSGTPGSGESPLGETLPATGGGDNPGGGTDAAPLGAVAGGGGGQGGGGQGGGSGGSGGSSLPFTGFSAAILGAFGSGMAAAGIALRRALSRGRSPR